ncbi:MAG: response regulator transcription factor [Chloroflexi bacterium]|nr:response regulator transcription factor [Chloroflexota bacterium]
MHIIVVEDDHDMAEAIQFTVQFHWPGSRVEEVGDGQQALEVLDAAAPDLVLLDLGLPQRDGFEVLREVRKTTQVPVIIITARGEELDKVRGLELGADDYITKPFSHLELLARIKAVLRRAEQVPTGLDVGQGYRDPHLEIDLARRMVQVAGQAVSLSPTEFNLLSYLVRNAGRIVPHALLLARVWGPEYEAETDYLRVYIRRLREKIERDPDRPTYLLTERGVGYRFQGVRW